ncbi:hypothetical protein PanWU01x14_162650 [Parasponia andersonii]|uniref:Uncharacterized protein n=1 Tax=Parasponia andersonii TaxID=3476 RepID=A0A2P5CD20_PARAD|nr:hypothetical protein PanWU01x14_162650 [Parasponia andersonii]
MPSADSTELEISQKTFRCLVSPPPHSNPSF